MVDYLTEDNLHWYLCNIFSGIEIVRDKTVPNSNIKNRPDFRIDELNLIVEFDGHLHFTGSGMIFADAKKDEVYSSMGYDIIRIPYFVQLDDEMQAYYFGRYTDRKFDTSSKFYPHGFIDKNAVLPADFCSLGVKRFSGILFKLPNTIVADIRKSLDNKIQSGKPDSLVYPGDLEISTLFKGILLQ